MANVKAATRCPVCGAALRLHTWSRQIQKFDGEDDTSGEVLEYIESKIELIDCSVCPAQWDLSTASWPAEEAVLEDVTDRIAHVSQGLARHEYNVRVGTPSSSQAHAVSTAVAALDDLIEVSRSLERRIHGGALNLRFVWLVSLLRAEGGSPAAFVPSSDANKSMVAGLAAMGLVRLSVPDLSRLSVAAGVTTVVARALLEEIGIHIDPTLE